MAKINEAKVVGSERKVRPLLERFGELGLSRLRVARFESELRVAEMEDEKRLKAEAEELRRAQRWGEMRPGHLVAMWAWLHREVYGIDPEPQEVAPKAWNTNALFAGKALKECFVTEIKTPWYRLFADLDCVQPEKLSPPIRSSDEYVNAGSLSP